jgi:hypothetical protein
MLCWLPWVLTQHAYAGSSFLVANTDDQTILLCLLPWCVCRAVPAAMLAMQALPKLLTGEVTPAAATDTPQQQQSAQPSVAQAARAPADTAAASSAPAAAAAAAASAAAAPAAAAAAAAKPVVVLLDVVLEAPVLLMPLSSGSDDLMEVDLGTLQLQNLVVWEMASEDKDRQKLLVDQMQVGCDPLWHGCAWHCSFACLLCGTGGPRSRTACLSNCSSGDAAHKITCCLMCCLPCVCADHSAEGQRVCGG